MKLSNLKSDQSRGFTIVELLIVIVVIGILATIIIVAYAGVTKQANISAAKGNAEGVQKVAEAYTADPAQSGSYPTFAQLSGYNGTTRVPSGVQLKDPTAAASWTAVNGSKTTIIYLPLATPANGGCVIYWDFNANQFTAIAVGQAAGNPVWNPSQAAASTSTTCA